MTGVNTDELGERLLSVGVFHTNEKIPEIVKAVRAGVNLAKMVYRSNPELCNGHFDNWAFDVIYDGKEDYGHLYRTVAYKWKV